MLWLWAELLHFLLCSRKNKMKNKRFFNTERQAEIAKKKYKKYKDTRNYKWTIQGNCLVRIPKQKTTTRKLKKPVKKYYRCVKKVKKSLKKYNRKGNAYAICKSSMKKPKKKRTTRKLKRPVKEYGKRRTLKLKKKTKLGRKLDRAKRSKEYHELEYWGVE